MNDPDLLTELNETGLIVQGEATLSPERQARLSLLLERNRQQTLTAAEEDELDRFLQRIDYLNILKARALLTLKYQEFMAGTGVPLSNEPTNDETANKDRIARAIAEIDLERLAQVRNLTSAQRVQEMASMIEEAEQAAVKRLRQEWPELSEIDALRIYRSRDSDD